MISVTLRFVPGQTYSVNADSPVTIKELCSYAQNLSQDGLDNFVPSVNGNDKSWDDNILTDCTILFAKKVVKGN